MQLALELLRANEVGLGPQALRKIARVNHPIRSPSAFRLFSLCLDRKRGRRRERERKREREESVPRGLREPRFTGRPYPFLLCFYPFPFTRSLTLFFFFLRPFSSAFFPPLCRFFSPPLLLLLLSLVLSCHCLLFSLSLFCLSRKSLFPFVSFFSFSLFFLFSSLSYFVSIFLSLVSSPTSLVAGTGRYLAFFRSRWATERENRREPIFSGNVTFRARRREKCRAYFYFRTGEFKV